MITYAKCPVLSKNFAHKILIFLRVPVTQKSQIVGGLCCVLQGIKYTGR